MSPTFSHRLLFSFLLLLSSSNGKSQTLIQKVCKDASKDSKYLTYKFCVRILQRDPSSQYASFEKLGLAALKLEKIHMSALKTYTIHLVKYGKLNDSYTKEALKDCVELYSDGIDSVKVAMMAYKVGDYSTANIQMSAAFDSPIDCEEGFNEGSSEVSPMKKLAKPLISCKNWRPQGTTSTAMRKEWRRSFDQENLLGLTTST